MERFNRQRLIERLAEMADEQQELLKFKHNIGTSQLYPEGQSNAKLDALIDRCVAYGRWVATQDFVADLTQRNLP